MANDSEQAQTTTANECSFYTIAAAEATLRQEQQRNDVLSTKLDEKFDELGKTIVTEVVAERWMGTTTRYRGREGDGSWVYRVDI